MESQGKFNPLDLTRRKILITGASSGIGRAVAIYLARLGASIVITGRNKDRLDITLSQLEGRNHMKIVADLAEYDDMSELFEEATEDGNKLKGLVHCAGVAQVIPINALTKKKLIYEMNLNYFSYIELIRQYAKRKFSDGGSIVGISSIAADRAGQCQTNYSASKASMDIASQALCIELAKKGIRINTVLPGAIGTDMTIRARESGVNMEEVERSQLLGMGEADDVAAACAFLISDMSKFITGRRLFVDGGRFL